jgi:hypothetical protein
MVIVSMLAKVGRAYDKHARDETLHHSPVETRGTASKLNALGARPRLHPVGRHPRGRCRLDQRLAVCRSLSVGLRSLER